MGFNSGFKGLIYIFDVSKLCILPPWRWPHSWRKPLAVHSVHKLLLVYLCALVSSIIVPIGRVQESSVHFTVGFYCAVCSILQYNSLSKPSALTRSATSGCGKELPFRSIHPCEQS